MSSELLLKILGICCFDKLASYKLSCSLLALSIPSSIKLNWIYLKKKKKGKVIG